MRIGWIGAAAVAIAAMVPGVAQAQDGTRTVGEWKLTTGSLKCMATTTTGSQTFIMYADADGNSGVQLLSPEAQAQTLGEDGTLDTALDGGDPIDFMITIENYGGKKVFDIPISLDIMVMDLTEGFTIDASWKGYDVFSMDLRRAGTEEVFREMIACEDEMKGDSEDDG